MASPHRKPSTRQLILDASMARLIAHGYPSFTLDAVGEDVGITRQAVLYHFSSKERLLSEIAIDVVTAESAALCKAVSRARNAPDAIKRFVLALVDHYVAEPAKLRVAYFLPQFASLRLEPDYHDRLHGVTGAAYTALEDAIRADPETPSGVHPRRLAVSVHLAAVGHVTMHCLTEAVGDPMLHGVRPLALELVQTLTRAWR